MDTHIKTGLFEIGQELVSLKSLAHHKGFSVFTFKGELLYDKSAFIEQISLELNFPESTQNWDALHDKLKDLCGITPSGIILIFEHTRLFRDRDSENFKMAITVLESVMEYWNLHHQIFAVWVLGAAHKK